MAQSRAVLAAIAWPAVLIPEPSFAQHPIIREKLEQWNAAAPQPSAALLADEVTKLAKTLYPISPACTQLATAVRKIEAATAERYVFTSIINRQVRNGWTAIVDHPGCDVSPVRYMIVQASNGSLSVTRVNRGESYAHDSLIADTFPLAFLQARLTLNRGGVKCEWSPAQARLGVMRVVGRETGLGPDMFGVRYAGAWTEEWPITLCERTVLVTVQFSADGDGGAYHSIKGDKARIEPATGS